MGVIGRVFFNIFAISGQGAGGQAWGAGIGVGSDPTGRPAPPPLSLDSRCIVAGKFDLRALSRQSVHDVVRVLVFVLVLLCCNGLFSCIALFQCSFVVFHSLLPILITISSLSIFVTSPSYHHALPFFVYFGRECAFYF
jgi:hypothetical protein